MSPEFTIDWQVALSFFSLPSFSLSQTGGSDVELKSTAMFETMQQMISSVGEELVRKVKAIYLWNITKEGKTAAQWSEWGHCCL